jgi:hypothetical protein
MLEYFRLTIAIPVDYTHTIPSFPGIHGKPKKADYTKIIITKRKKSIIKQYKLYGLIKNKKLENLKIDRF